MIGLGGLVLGRGRITLKELLVQELIMVVLIAIAFFSSAYLKSRDKEIWNGVIVSKEKTTTPDCHTYPCNCRQICSGSGESRSCYTHCDTCNLHPYDIKWTAKTSNDEVAYINNCNPPGTSEPKRFSDIVIGEPTAIEHSYTNYLKGNQDTILKRFVPDKKFDIPEYPEVYDWYRVKRFIGIGVDDNRFDEYDNKLDKINAEFGSAKQVNISVFVVKESDQFYFEKLREEWLGGKKNDFIVVVGTPEYPKISWAQVLSWSDSEDAKVFVKNRILALGEFDGDKVLKIVEEEVRDKYIRKEMKDFEYLKFRIEPSATVKIVILILSIATSIGLSIYFKNEEVL